MVLAIFALPVELVCHVLYFLSVQDLLHCNLVWSIRIFLVLEVDLTSHRFPDVCGESSTTLPHCNTP